MKQASRSERSKVVKSTTRNQRQDVEEPQNSLKSTDRILSSFAVLVAERGYGRTSLADVARIADVSKGTILHHFGTKERLLEEVEAAYMERRHAEIDVIELSYPDPLDRLVGAIYALLRVHRDERSESQAFMREFVRFAGSAESMRRVRETRQHYQDRISGILRAGQRSGILQIEDLALTTLQMFGMCNHAWTWYRPDGTHSLRYIGHIFIETFIKGLASDPTTAARATQRLPEIASIIDGLTPSRLTELAAVHDLGGLDAPPVH